MMYEQGKRKSTRNMTLIIDWIHIVIGGLIVVMAVVTFLNPEGNQFCFPLIFFLAAVLNTVNGIHRLKYSGREKKRKIWGIVQLAVALALLCVTVASAVSIWR